MRPLQSLFRNLLILVTAVYLASVIYIWFSHLDNVESNLRHINSMVRQAAHTTLTGHELILRGIGEELVALGALENPENGRELIDRLTRIDPGMIGFGLIRPDGQILLVSNKTANQKLPNLLDHEASRGSFLEVLKSKNIRTGHPYFFKLFNDWVVPIRTPIFDHDGKLVGVMGAGYRIENASAAWTNADLPPHTRTLLIGDDGYPIFAQPLIEASSPNESLNKTYSQSLVPASMRRIQKLAGKQTFGFIHTPRIPGHEHHYFSYSYLDRYNLHVVVLEDLENVILNWLKRLIAPTLLVVIVVLGGSFVFYRTRQRQEMTESSLLQSELRYQTLFNSASDAIFLMSADKFIDCNRASLSLFGCERHELLNTSPVQFSPEYQPDGSLSSSKAIEKLNLALSGKNQIFEWRHKRPNGEEFDAEITLNAVELYKQTLLLAMVRDITERKRFEEQLEFQAHHDSLTGLPNRLTLHQGFEKFAQEADKNDYAIAMMLIDLDRFKEINDTLGHHAGDEVLLQIGPRLRKLFKDRDVLFSRLGGDEFAVVIPLNNSDSVDQIANRIVSTLREPFLTESLKVRVGASIGISLYPDHGNNSHELLRAADVAMYQAKKLSTGIKRYDQDSDDYSTWRLSLSHDLTRALSEHQLVLHYQPKIDVSSGKVTGYEALVRWQHPVHGLLFPDSFLDLVEMSDQIQPFTQRVIERAVMDIKELAKAGYHFPVAINLSARNLSDGSCYDTLTRQLKKHQLTNSDIELELTESALMHDPQTSIESLQQFKDNGIAIMIDDFGTGYSSLSYLQKLPVTALKIDRSFVTDMLVNKQNSEIVRSTITLAHSLDLQVVAEGVEQFELVETLREMQCDFAQGYGICRPQPLDKLIEWLSDQAG